jgi:hypothetical protein
MRVGKYVPVMLLVLLFGLVLSFFYPSFEGNQANDPQNDSPSTGKEELKDSTLSRGDVSDKEERFFAVPDSSQERMEQGRRSVTNTRPPDGARDVHATSDDRNRTESGITILPADDVKFLDQHALTLAHDADFSAYPSIEQLPDLVNQIAGNYEGLVQWIGSHSVGKAELRIKGIINKDRKFEGSFVFRIMDQEGQVMAEPGSVGLIGDRIRIDRGPNLTVYIEPDSKSNNKKDFNNEGDDLRHAAYIHLVKKDDQE